MSAPLDEITLLHMSQLNSALYRRFQGLGLLDLTDEEVGWLKERMEVGFTADEAIDDVMEGPL